MSEDPVLAQLHAWLAAGAAVAAAALVIGGVIDTLGVVRPGVAKRWLDRLLLALLGLVTLAAILGPLVLLLVGPPDDWLHLLYAAVVLAAAPIARLIADRRGSARVGAWVATGGLVTLGALLRLWMTGG